MSEKREPTEKERVYLMHIHTLVKELHRRCEIAGIAMALSMDLSDPEDKATSIRHVVYTLDAKKELPPQFLMHAILMVRPDLGPPDLAIFAVDMSMALRDPNAKLN